MANDSFKVKRSFNITPTASPTLDQAGDMGVDSDASNKLKFYDGAVISAVVTEAQAATLTNKTIDADSNTITNIEDADIKSGAAINASKIGGGTVSNTEFSYLDGVTSAIQTQLDAKAAAATLTAHTGASSGVHGVVGSVVGTSDAQALTNKTIDADSNTITNIENADIKAAAAIDATKIADGSVSNTEFQYLDGVTSAIQTQLNGKQATGNYITSLTGDVTASGPGAAAATIAANAVTNAKAAQMAANTIKGNNTGVTANASDLTAAQATAILSAMVGDSGSGGTKGLVPAPAAGDTAAGRFLKADGTWAVPTAAGSGNSYVRLYTGNGFGSTGTKIRRFATTSVNTGTDITYTDSATNGASFTINTAGVYAITYGEEGNSGAPQFGITLNASSNTTDINSLAAAEILNFSGVGTGNDRKSIGYVGIFAVNDVIRAHTNSTGSNFVSAGTGARFSIVRIGG